MFAPQPRLLAVAAGVVLLGGVTAAATLDPDTEGSTPAGSSIDISADEAPPSDPTDGDSSAITAPDGDDAPAEREDRASTDGAPSGKGGTADGDGSVTDDTLRQMLDRDLDDAVRTYQDLGAREAD